MRLRGLLHKSMTVSLLLIAALMTGRTGAAQSRTPSAYDLWIQTLESSLTGAERELTLLGTDRKITYGAEKEGSSALITRVMGPGPEALKNWLNLMSEDDRTEVLRKFFTAWKSGASRKRDVVDAQGQRKQIDLSRWASLNPSTATLPVLTEAFEAWLGATEGRPFSFLTEKTRMELVKGYLPGKTLPRLDGSRLRTLPNGDRIYSGVSYSAWVSNFGEPEKYVQAAHDTGVGWEINFHPQPTFAAFEKMIAWFQLALKNAGVPFEAPGHQRLVLPRSTEGSPVAALTEARMAEMYRHVQAYILLRSLAGKAGAEIGNFKSVLSDDSIARLQTSRGLIRLEKDRFAGPSYSIELRAGTKTDLTRRFSELLIASRYASGDFEGVHAIQDWTLIPNDPRVGVPHFEGSANARAIAARFDLPVEIVQQAIKNITTPKTELRGIPRKIQSAYLAPLWSWENAPYLSQAKKAHLKELTRTFLRSLSAWDGATIPQVQEALAVWTKASGLILDIETYLRPRAPPARGGALAKLFEYRPVRAKPTDVDVNRIDLGIEYSARFPVKLQSEKSDFRLQDGKFAWLGTLYDLTLAERVQVLENFSKTLGQYLNQGRFTRVVREATGGHGHEFVIAFELKDRQGRTWRVEWDGVGRSYDPEGNVIEGSARGGHVEVVTPKFVPAPEEVAAVFRAFEKHGLHSVHMGGGGHINIDLAPFEGKPRELARFLALFHQHRGIIAALFQHPGRLRSAEPVELSPILAQRLADFRGSEAELKRLLYDGRYFNPRLGRKSRYLQLDVSAYFQDVVPEMLITQDYDLMNDPWRPAFNVDPRIRKMEFRLFDAPRNEVEAALQVKLVRALLHQALNSESRVTAQVQTVDHGAYVKKPAQAWRDLEALCRALDIPAEEYRPILVESLAQARDVISLPHFLPFDQVMEPHPRVTEGWGRSVEPRPAIQALASEGRPFTGEVLPQARQALATRRQAAQQAQAERTRIEAARAAGRIPSVLSRQDCVDRQIESAIGEVL